MVERGIIGTQGNQVMSAVVRLAQMRIESVDLEASVAFYASLGARRQFEFCNMQDELVGMYLSFGKSRFIEIVKLAELKREGRDSSFRPRG